MVKRDDSEVGTRKAALIDVMKLIHQHFVKTNADILGVIASS